MVPSCKLDPQQQWAIDNGRLDGRVNQTAYLLVCQRQFPRMYFTSNIPSDLPERDLVTIPKKTEATVL